MPVGEIKYNIDYTKESYNYFFPMWEKCRDVVKGSDAVKVKGETYLPRPNGQEDEDYEAYKKRARFFNASKRTVQAMIGQTFRVSPVVDSGGVNIAEFENVDAEGTTLQSFFKLTSEELYKVGRFGVLIDHSDAIDSNAYLVPYYAEQITNWRYAVMNGNTIPVLIVLKESYEDYTANEFKPEVKTRYRVLKIDESGNYIQQVWIKKNALTTNTVASENAYELQSEVMPLMNGGPLKYIPFFIINSSRIGLEIEEPVINDLVDTNIGHYVNSAEFEHELHWAAIKTPIFPGHNSDDPITVGKPLACAIEAKPYIMECNPGSLIKEEMTAKEQRMAVLGAQIIAQKGRYVEAAETARIQASGESGILAGLANLLSQFFTDYVLPTFLQWNMIQLEGVTVTFNTDFEPGTLASAEAVQLASLVDLGKMSMETLFYNYKRGELYPEGWNFEDEQIAIQEFKDKKAEEDAQKIETAMQSMIDQNSFGSANEPEQGQGSI